MTDSLSRSDGPAFASGFDPDVYQYEPIDSDGRSFQSLLDDVSSQGGRDSKSQENNVPPPMDLPGGSDHGDSSSGALKSVAHQGACAVAGAVVGGAGGALIGAVGEGLAGAGAGSLVPVFGTGAGAILGAGDGAWKGAFFGSAAGAAVGAHLCGGTTGPASPAAQIYQSVSDPGRTRPTGAIGGAPTGIRSATRPGVGSEEKAQVDSENHVADTTAAAGYRTVQNPTRGPDAALTPKRMAAEGLKPYKNPDLLIENRIFDTYTPLTDDAASVRSGIAEKVYAGQTHRVVVDLRQTNQTEASVRSALRNAPVPGLKEVMVLSNEGLGQPFRP